MKNNYIKPIIATIVGLIILFAVTPATTKAASADTGPKWFVDITFKNLPEGELYATLLSKSESTGPYSFNYSHYAESGTETQKEIDLKFGSYTDKDGYYYLHNFKKLGENANFHWGYYPPTKFKILIYSKTTDEFIENNEIFERYAFASYYTYDVKTGTTVKSYDYFGEIVKLVFRILITIGIEIAIALLFKYRGDKLIFIAIVNVITQLILNILLNVINYQSGWLMMAILYISCEIIVFLLEAVAYSVGMTIIENKHEEKHTFFLLHVLYALAANLASFILGGAFMLILGM